MTDATREGLCPECLGRLVLAHPAPDLFAAPRAEQSGDRIGHYRLQEKIGEGGFGVVYLAEQDQPVRRRVALKVIKLGMDTREVVARFEAERQALAMMDHPHIARVFDAGATESGRPYFVMELVEGIPITKYCNQGKLGLKERLELFGQVCQAIQHAHQKGIIHRDIKPSNILVATHGGLVVPKVIDFGIAKATGVHLTDETIQTQVGQLMGTPAYMSPEQAEVTGVDIDTRSDIYSLGVLLYELLTGRPPFSSRELIEKGLAEARRVIREVEPPRPSTRLSTLTQVDLAAVARERSAEAPRLLNAVRGDLDWIVMKCLEKDRARRYETANDLGLDVKRFLGHEAIMARPPSAVYQWQKLMRRHRTAVATAAVILATLVTGLSVSTWSFLRERSTRRQLEQSRTNEMAALQLAKEKAEAEAHQRERAERTVTRLELERAESFFEAGRASDALAYLARTLRREPTNRVVAERILGALVYRNLSVPLARIPASAGVVSAEFSQDGRRFLTASTDGTAQIWDGWTGQPMLQLSGHTSNLTAAHFDSNGTRVVTASLDRTVRIWDARTGVAIIPPLPHTSDVLSAEFSPDGQRVATGTVEGRMQQWDARTGAPLNATGTLGAPIHFLKFSRDGQWLFLATAANLSVRLLRAADGGVVNTYGTTGRLPWRSPMFSRDSRFLLISPWSKQVEILETATGARKRLLTSEKFLMDLVCAQFSPDGLRVVTSSLDNAATVWDVDTLERVGQPLVHEHTVETADFSPNGDFLATGSRDQTVRLWETRTGRSLGDLLRHDAPLASVEFSSDGRRILSRCNGGSVWLWEIRTDQPLTAYLPHPPKVRGAVFSPDGRRIATAALDDSGDVRMWHSQTASPLREPLDSLTFGGVQFSDDGRLLAGVGLFGGVGIWDGITGDVIVQQSTTNRYGTVRFSPDGKMVVTGGDSRQNGGFFSHGTAVIWDVFTGKSVMELPHQDTIGYARFSPNGQWVVTTVADNTVRIWDWRVGRLLTEPMRHDGRVVWLDISPDSGRIVTLARDHTARIWEAPSGKLLHTLSAPLEPYHFNSVQFSPDGRLVAVASGNLAQVWDASAGQPVTAPMKHEGRVHSVRFSPDSKRLVTSSQDQTARIWDAETGHPLGEPMHHEARVNSAEFSRDGRWILTASDDGSARLWELPALNTPIPSWLADWAEVVAGQRLDERIASHPVPVEAMRQLRQTISEGPSDSDAVRWARWFFTENQSRSVSPGSALPVAALIERRLQPSMLPSLQQAVRLAPTHARAIAWLSLATLTNGPAGSSNRVADAEWQSRRSLELAPADPDVLCARAQLCGHLGRLSEALETMERAVTLGPTNASGWNQRGLLLERTNRDDEAIRSYTRAIEVSGSWTGMQTLPALAYANRSRLHLKMGRRTEAGIDNLKARNLPQRDPQLPATLLDLSPFYNDEDGGVPAEWRRLAPQFDARGGIYFAYETSGAVAGIPVAQQCRRVRFLQATFGKRGLAGLEIGYYRIQYRDGRQARIPIVYGENVRSFMAEQDLTDTLQKNSQIAWRGTVKGTGAVRLSEFTWENDRPSVEIVSFDLVALETGTLPALFAVTVDP